MEPRAETQTFIRYLAATTKRIEAIAARLPADKLGASPAPGGWSPNEILWHIRAVADVYGEQIRRILAEETPRWRHVSPRARMKKARYDQVPFEESFVAFVRQRAELVDLLAGLAPEAWQRAALIRVEQRESRLTLRERVWGMTKHEAIHCDQMDAVVTTLQQPTGMPRP